MKKCQELKVIVVNPLTDKQKDEILQRVQDYFNNSIEKNEATSL